MTAKPKPLPNNTAPSPRRMSLSSTQDRKLRYNGRIDDTENPDENTA